jgi:hypothetical protein
MIDRHGPDWLRAAAARALMKDAIDTFISKECVYAGSAKEATHARRWLILRRLLMTESTCPLYDVLASSTGVSRSIMSFIDIPFPDVLAMQALSSPVVTWSTKLEEELDPKERVRAMESRAEDDITRFLSSFRLREAGRFVGHKSGSRGSTEEEARRRGKATAGITKDGVNLCIGEYDDDGVWVYQAYNDAISDWALAHQSFGGPSFKAKRMTWMKPSFAWVLYRSGYGKKKSQERVLKIKLPHDSFAALLEQCAVGQGGGGASTGRVQWDPARDLLAAEKSGKEPRKLLRRRAIQIGVKGALSEEYVSSALAIVDVTALAQRVGAAHRKKKPSAVTAAIALLLSDLPYERPFMPRCADATLVKLGMLPPGGTADLEMIAAREIEENVRRQCVLLISAAVIHRARREVERDEGDR